MLVPAALVRAQAEGFSTSRTVPSMLVFAASGSMGAEDVDGLTRMDVAKEAVTTLVSMLRRVFGCLGLLMLVEPGRQDREVLISAIEGGQPRGVTPIGMALTEVADALSETEMRFIVLVRRCSDAEVPRVEVLVKMTRTARGYATQGRPITGGTNVEDAVGMPPGTFLDVLEHGSPAIDDGEGLSRP